MNAWATSILWGMLQVTLLATFGTLLYAAARRRGPAAGALASIGTLLAVLIVTVLSMAPLPNMFDTQSAWRRMASVWSSARADAASPPAATNDTADDTTASPAMKVTPANSAYLADFWDAFVDEMRRAPVEQSGATRRWPAAVLALFALGAALGLFRLIAGATAVRSYRRHSRPVVDAALARLMESLREENGCRAEIEVRETGRLSTPATVGCFRPLVLLPDGWRTWTRDELRAVLAHEIAHVARGDYLSGLLAQVTLAIHFYHPLVHWLVGRLRLEQELAADASGMRSGGGRDQYLVTLAGMALRQDDLAVSWAARPFLPTRGTFMRRIEMLRDSRKQTSATLPRGGRALLIGAVAVAALAVAGLRPGDTSRAVAQPPTGGQDATFELSQKNDLLRLYNTPQDAVVVIAARPADILSKPEMANIAKMLNETLGSKLGISIDQLEQVNVAFVVAEGAPEPIPCFSLRAKSQTDWKQLIEGMTSDFPAKPVELGSHRYLKLENHPQNLCIVTNLSGQDITIQPEGALKDDFAYADQVEKAAAAGKPLPASKWAPLWKEVADGQAAIGVDPAFFRKELDKIPLERLGPMIGFAPLWKETEIAVLGIGLENGMEVKGYAKAATPEGAERISQTLSAAKTMFQNMEQGLRRQVMNEPAESATLALKGLDAASMVINSATLTTKDSVVELKAQGPADTAVVIGVLAPAVAQAREAARRAQSMNNMKQIGLAMHNYLATHQHLPGSVVMGPDGKTPHSWRVALLPYIEQDALYRLYKFDEPWDSDNNKKVLAQMPAVYRSPDGGAQPNTSYFVLTGPTTMFNGAEGATLASVADGLSNTIMTVEAKRDVPWTKPEDIAFDPSQPVPQLGGFNQQGFNVGMGDGSVRFLSNLVSAEMLKALITKSGGEPISNDSFNPKLTPPPAQ